jgi:hypothetical protein
MPTSTASPRALLALALFLGGPILCLLGFLLSAVGLYLIASGYAFGHNGGVPALVFGVPAAVLGLLATRRGRRMYRGIESASKHEGEA